MKVNLKKNASATKIPGQFFNIKGLIYYDMGISIKITHSYET